MCLGFDLGCYLSHFDSSLGCRSNWWRNALCGGVHNLTVMAKVSDSLVTGWCLEVLVCGSDCVVLVPDKEENVVQRLMQE